SDGAGAIDYLAGKGEFADRTKYPLPCLLLLDLKMPYKDGFEVLQWVRRNDALKSLKVVIVTSSNLERDRARARALGVTDFIVKPPGIAGLVQILQERKEGWLTKAV